MKLKYLGKVLILIIKEKNIEKEININRQNIQSLLSIVSYNHYSVGENKGENINECQVIKDNDSQEQSPENLKISGEYRDKFKNSDVFYVIIRFYF